jgi:hypothetical protein
MLNEELLGNFAALDRRSMLCKCMQGINVGSEC